MVGTWQRSHQTHFSELAPVIKCGRTSLLASCHPLIYMPVLALTLLGRTEVFNKACWLANTQQLWADLLQKNEPKTCDSVNTVVPILHKRTEAGTKARRLMRSHRAQKQKQRTEQETHGNPKTKPGRWPHNASPQIPYCIHLAALCVLPPRPLLQLKDPAPHCQPEPLLWPPNQHQMTNLKPNASIVSTLPAPSSAYRILFKSKINYFSSAALWIKKKWNYKIKRKKKMLWRDSLPPSLPHSSSVFLLSIHC